VNDARPHCPASFGGVSVETWNRRAPDPRLASLRRVKELEARPAPAHPVAWIKGHTTHTDCGVEYDEECVPGRDSPTGGGWHPLYVRPEFAMRDTERMDWIEQRAHALTWTKEGEKLAINADDGAEFIGDTYRAAIDAARGSEG